jgi:hypothetical protein
MGGYISAPRWSPDGTWVVFIAIDEQPGGQGIWKVDLQNGLKKQLSSSCTHSMVRQPSLSLDGKWIAAPLCTGDGVALIDTDTFTAAEWAAPARVAAVAWAGLPTQAATSTPEPAPIKAEVATASAAAESGSISEDATTAQCTGETVALPECYDLDEGPLSYRNENFGFQLTLPPAWKGYQTTEHIFSAGQLPDAGSVCFTFEGHMPICVLKIDIWTKEAWAKQDWIPEGYYLSENKSFVFAEGPYQEACVQLDDFQCKRHQELPAILATLRTEQ